MNTQLCFWKTELRASINKVNKSPTLGNWVLDFLTNRPQTVRIHNTISSSITLSTGSPQGCVLSPLLFTLLTYDCSARHPSCHIVKFADTAVVGRIIDNDESEYREEVEHLVQWCRGNNLCINVKKTKEMVVDFRRDRRPLPPLYIGGVAVEVVSSFRYLGVYITEDLTWSANTTRLVRKAHQRLYFLRKLRRAGLGSSVLRSFYHCAVESVLCTCITVWHGSCTAAEKRALQRVVRTAQRTVGSRLPTITDLYTARCRGRALRIMKDSTHPAHGLFQPLPSGRRLRSIRSNKASSLKLLDCWTLAMLYRHSFPPPECAHARTHIHTRRLTCTKKHFKCNTSLIIGAILRITSFGLFPLAHAYLWSIHNTFFCGLNRDLSPNFVP